MAKYERAPGDRPEEIAQIIRMGRVPQKRGHPEEFLQGA